MTTNVTAPNVDLQIAMNGAAGRARAERDQKQFVRQVFAELEYLKAQNALILERLEALSAPKSEAVLQEYTEQVKTVVSKEIGANKKTKAE